MASENDFMPTNWLAFIQMKSRIGHQPEIAQDTGDSWATWVIETRMKSDHFQQMNTCQFERHQEYPQQYDSLHQQPRNDHRQK